jgi:hypothetical protein
MRQMASILRDATFHPHLYSYGREGRKLYGLYIYGLDETRLFHRMIGFVGRKGLRLSKVISQFERRGAQPGTARWRSKTPPSVAVKHSNGARPKRPLDGSGSRSKEKKPADGRLQARLRISPGLPTILVDHPDRRPRSKLRCNTLCNTSKFSRVYTTHVFPLGLQAC